MSNNHHCDEDFVSDLPAEDSGAFRVTGHQWTFAQLWALASQDTERAAGLRENQLPDDAKRYLIAIRETIKTKQRELAIERQIAEPVPSDCSKSGISTRLRTAQWYQRPRLLRLAMSSLVAACVILGLLVVFLPLRSSHSEAAIWHSGLSRMQLREKLSEFAALRAAPNALPTAAEATPGPDEILTPNFKEEGFEVRSDSKFYDMTWWRPIDVRERDNGRLSPVVFTRVMTLRRIPNHPGNSKLRIKFWTTGFCVDPVKLKPGDEVLAARKPEGLAKDGPQTKTYSLTTDVSDHPVGEWFQLTVSAIYWNGFNTPVKEWAGSAAASSDVKDADLGVLLPPERSIRMWSLYNIPPGEVRAPENRIRAGHPPRDESGLIYWPIPSIEQGHKYVIEWEWDDQGQQNK